jgi:hypothetical protein
MAAIQHAHDERGLESPTRSKAVQNVMRGIRRESDRTPEQAPPLLTEHIKNMVDALPGNGSPPNKTEAEAAWLRGRRDRALILTGFAGAFRRSELAAIRRIEDSDYCPVKALRRWASVASIDDGPIFRGVPRSGLISRDAITGRTVGNAVKRAADAAGLPQADRSYSPGPQQETAVEVTSKLAVTIHFTAMDLMCA